MSRQAVRRSSVRPTRHHTGRRNQTRLLPRGHLNQPDHGAPCHSVKPPPATSGQGIEMAPGETPAVRRSRRARQPGTHEQERDHEQEQHGRAGYKRGEECVHPGDTALGACCVKLPDLITAVSPLGEAIDGAVKPRTRRKAAGGPGVTTRFRCGLCGHEDSDKVAIIAHLQAELASIAQQLGALRRADGTRFVALCGTPAGYSRHRRAKEPPCPACRAAQNTYDRARLSADPECRARKRAIDRASHARRSADPAWRERRNARRRARLAADPEHRERLNARQQAKRAADPEYRERMRQLDRAYRERKRDRENAAARENGAQS